MSLCAATLSRWAFGAIWSSCARRWYCWCSGLYDLCCRARLVSLQTGRCLARPFIHTGEALPNARSVAARHRRSCRPSRFSFRRWGVAVAGIGERAGTKAKKRSSFEGRNLNQDTCRAAVTGSQHPLASELCCGELDGGKPGTESALGWDEAATSASR